MGFDRSWNVVDLEGGSARGWCVDEAGDVSRVETTDWGPEEQLMSDEELGKGRSTKLLPRGESMLKKKVTVDGTPQKMAG